MVNENVAIGRVRMKVDSFLAAPGKRISAFVYDTLAVFLAFLLLASVAEASGFDPGAGRIFVACAFVYHYAFLAFREGRTFGKQAQDICVVSADGQRLSQWQAVLRPALRYVPLMLLTIDIHDRFVVDALVGLGAKIAAALVWLGELSLLQNTPARQTLADRLSKTIVVNLPPLEPYRAPAIPMYSATDKEFGTPPKRPPAPDQKMFAHAIGAHPCRQAYRSPNCPHH